MIKAPFNFVPLNDKVYIPDWADKISQDVPFSDGLYGKIKISIVAETPIFICDGHTPQKEKNNEIQEFCHTDDGIYYIPGTSIKGAIRSVMEILSFGKMTQVQNRSFKKKANRVYDGIPQNLRSKSQYDLCECIFGYTGKDDSLKGRVQITSAFLLGQPKYYGSENGIKIALSKPHPSYYPIYLGNGQTWSSEQLRIAGRKRYPVRDKCDIFSNEGSEDMERFIKPIDIGSRFVGHIHFHNLKPVELGALFAAIDFCHHEECSHSLGLAKPLGYGRVKIKVEDADIKIQSNLDNSIYQHTQAFQVFTDMMKENISNWEESEQLRELFAMARGIERGRGSLFEYMKMSKEKEDNQFETAKKEYDEEGIQLGLFTQILNNVVIPKVFLKKEKTATESKIDDEKALHDLDFSIKVSERTDLIGKDGLIIINDALQKLSQLPTYLRSPETDSATTKLRNLEKNISKAILKEEKRKNQESNEDNEVIPNASQNTNREKVEENGVLAKVTFWKREGNNTIVNILIEEGKRNKGKVTVPINANTRNINWKKVKHIRVEFINNEFKFIKVVQ